jgi:hypothetical protein
MLRNGLILILAVVALILSGDSRAAVTVFQDPSGTPGNPGTPGLPAVAITAIAPAGTPQPLLTTPLQLFYQTGPANSTTGTVCLSGNGDEVCGWDIHVSTTSSTVILQTFVPDAGAGSDIVWAISGNVFRANGGIPTTGEAVGSHRIGTLHVSKASADAAGAVTVAGNLFVSAALAAVPVTAGNTLAIASAAGLDTDLDGVEDAVDNCKDTPNGPAQAAVTNVGNQIDGTTAWTAGQVLEASLVGGPDGVGDACDNCPRAVNPRESATFLTTTGAWATLTGGQRDDDHDGFGNKCDADFTPTGALVGTADLTQFRASNNKNRANDQCGTNLTQPCARYDLDQSGALIGTGDLTVFRALNNKAAGPKCPTCPLACTAGTAGNCF